MRSLTSCPTPKPSLCPSAAGGSSPGWRWRSRACGRTSKSTACRRPGRPACTTRSATKPYETLDAVDTFADGIAVKTPGEQTFEIIKQYADDIVTVSEDEIAAAILALMENQKLVAEGAGATPVAAALFGKLPVAGKKTVCLISGGNIDVNILSRVINRGLIMSGRKCNLTIALEDKPGQLTRVSEIISGCGANVVSVQYDLATPTWPSAAAF